MPNERLTVVERVRVSTLNILVQIFRLEMKNHAFSSSSGYAPGSSAAKKKQKVNLLVLIIVYLFTFIGFTFLVVSQATTSWTIVDNYKDFVYPDEYQGLWQLCYDKQEYECIPREGLCKQFKLFPEETFVALTLFRP